MLDEATQKRILAFVAAQPRSIDEIAKHLGKNWRTADRYVVRIAQETGALSVRTFREGSQGALKVVYLVTADRIPGTQVQDRLFARILAGRQKTDFSALEIYENASPERRSATLHRFPNVDVAPERDLIGLVRGAQQQIHSFSGNLSWTHRTQDGERLIDALAKRAAAGVAIRVVCRVDLATVENLREIEAINARLGREAIEVRHCEQPLRGLVIDDRVFHLKEVLDPERYRPGELSERTFLFYDISDPSWVAWATRVFWRLFQTGTPAARRLAAIASIQVPLPTKTSTRTRRTTAREARARGNT
jgi:hypothetical protein